MTELTPESIDDFRQRLIEAKAAAESLLEQTTEDARPVEVSGSTIGRLTRMDAMQMQAMAQMNQRQLGIRLQQISVALAAIEQGTYGICRHCKEPISIARLTALPEAPFCMDCQEGFE
jgi:DnaK suppressor protein